MKKLLLLSLVLLVLTVGCASYKQLPGQPTFTPTATPEKAAPTPTAAPTATPTVASQNPTPNSGTTGGTAPVVAPLASYGRSIKDALDIAGPFPFSPVQAQDENGRRVLLINKGFDLKEFGGNDSKCTRTQLDSIHIGEVVSSQNEGCLTVIEWSLKSDATTVIAGTYALRPGEWFYIPLAVAGINDRVRIVGTLWYLPKDWNAHMYAADLAGDRDLRDKTASYVGLSPTDDYVVKLANAMAGK